MTNDLARMTDPISFIEEVLLDPSEKPYRPFVLYEEQKEFLRRAFTLDADGRMVFTELVFSCGKKGGKSTLAACIVLYTAFVLAGIAGEIYVMANDLEQAQSRVFKLAVAILKVSPKLKDAVTIVAGKISIKSTGTFVQAIANDFAGFAGSNPTLNCYDESAYFTSEGSRRLFDEGIPSPARRISFRLSVSTAGFEGEPSPLADLYKRMMEKGVEVAPDLRVHENLLAFWSNRMPLAPWQSPKWIREQEQAYAARPSQYKRLILNQWVSSESAFIELAEWDAITDPYLEPLLAKTGFPVWVGLDVGLRHDSTAILVVGWDGNHLRLVDHQIFIPKKGETIDIEQTIETAILQLRSRFGVRNLFYDPWQCIGLAQRLIRRGVPCTEYPQTPANLSAMAGNLLALIVDRGLVVYKSDELRKAVSQTVAIENTSGRGWRLGKAKSNARVDPVIALAMACMAAMDGAGMSITQFGEDIASMQRARGGATAAFERKYGGGTGHLWNRADTAENAERLEDGGLSEARRRIGHLPIGDMMLVGLSRQRPENPNRVTWANSTEACPGTEAAEAERLRVQNGTGT